MPLIQLRRDWPGNFRRSVIAEKKVVRVLEWSPGEILELAEGPELDAVAKDLGKSLQEVVFSTVLGKHVRKDACPPEPVEESADAGEEGERLPDEPQAPNPLKVQTSPGPVEPQTGKKTKPTAKKKASKPDQPPAAPVSEAEAAAEAETVAPVTEASGESESPATGEGEPPAANPLRQTAS